MYKKRLKNVQCPFRKHEGYERTGLEQNSTHQQSKSNSVVLIQLLGLRRCSVLSHAGGKSPFQKSSKRLMDFPLRNSHVGPRKRYKVTCLARRFHYGHCKSSAVPANTWLSFFFLGGGKNSDKMEKERSLVWNTQMALVIRPLGSWTNYSGPFSGSLRLITHKCDELVAIFHKAREEEVVPFLIV